MKSSLYEYGVIIGESRIHIKSDSEEAVTRSVEDLKYHREQLLEYIRRNPEFRYALKPVKISRSAPKIVQKMDEASRIADVGPMASVAGAFADLGLESMLEREARVAVIENGGEVAAFTDRPISVTIVSSSLDISGRIGFHITPEDCPIGIATSSSKTNHAISFGEADSVTVVAETASLADAVATSICNAVKGNDVEASIQRGLRESTKILGIRGALITREGHVGLIGNTPKIIRVIDV